MLIDSHAHLDFYRAAKHEQASPEQDRDGKPTLNEVLAQAHSAGVETILAIGIGDGPATMHRALEIAKAVASEKTARDSGSAGLPDVYASVGIHPQEAHGANPEALAILNELLGNSRTIALGEIGLDYYHVENPEVSVQQAAFIAQLRLAVAARKPILIHCRTSELATPQAKVRFGDANAEHDLIDLLAEHWSPHGIAGIMHCFSGDLEYARRSLDLGFYLSFAGNLTYPKSIGIRDAAAFAPADRILVETDAPFLAPVPHRGQTNQPALVVHTARALAELRGVTPELIAEQTTANFHQIFPSTKSAPGSDTSKLR